MACKFEAASIAIDFKNGDVVASLIATVKKTASWVKIETARIIAASPLIANMCQLAICSDTKDANAVVQAVASVHKFAIGRDHYLRTEIATCESWRQR